MANVGHASYRTIQAASDRDLRETSAVSGIVANKESGGTVGNRRNGRKSKVLPPKLPPMDSAGCAR